MPYTPEHKDQTRTRILESARRLFNRGGLVAVSIDDIMAGAGLTRGGFYNHFGSKEELYAEAITHFLHSPAPPVWQCQAMQDALAGRPLAEAILDAYLSRAHLADLDGSCPVIGLATDVARSGPAAKAAYRQVMAMMADIFSASLGPSPVTDDDEVDLPARRQRAFAVVALCVGGMVLARGMDDEGVADELCAAARRYAVGLAGWQQEASGTA